jgi:hypothetical protein
MPFLNEAHMKHVSQFQDTYIEEFIPKIGPYLCCILDFEGFGDDYMPELRVCSVRVEMLQLLSCTCTLQGVLPKVTSATSFSQSSKMGRKIPHAIMVAKGVFAI